MLPEAPSAETPLIEGERRRLIQLANQFKSNFGIHYSLLEVAREVDKESRKYNGLALDATIASLEDADDQSVFVTLLEVIPRSARNSMLKSTVAYDFYGQEYPYHGDHPGTYVVGIAIAGRGGKFLTMKECGELADKIQGYVLGHRVWKDKAVRNVTLSSLELSRLSFCRKIDKQFVGETEDGSPFFIDNQSMDRKALLLVEWLKKMANINLNPTSFETDWLCQSPQYVGCATNVNKQLAEHEPIPGNLKRSMSGKMLGLVLSIINTLEDLNGEKITPEIVGLPVVPTWCDSHLVHSERLVTLLASSLVTQGGLNITQAGGQMGPDSDDTERYVLAQCPYFAENAEATLSELATYCDSVADLRIASGVFGDDDYVQTRDELESRRKKLESTMGRVKEFLESVTAEDVAALDSSIEDMKKQLEELERISLLVDRLEQAWEDN